MHTILLQYKPGVRGNGFRALATKFRIKGGHKLISSWYSKWDGTELSLEKQSGGDKRSILTPKERKKHIYDFVDKKSKSEAVKYTEVKKNVEKKTNKRPALRTVQRNGKSLGITSKKRKRTLKSQGFFSFFFVLSFSLSFSSFLPDFVCLETDAYRESVSNIRKKFQRVSKNRLVFIDGSGIDQSLEN
jgi:hypothetical protein